MPEPVTVLVFSDYACPWCYLGLHRLRRAAAGLNVGVRMVAFPLSPDTPPEGRHLGDYLRARGVPVDEANARLKALMDLEGLPFNTSPDTQAFNTRRAQEFAAWAEGMAPGVHDALFRAVHVDNVNVHDLDVLARIATDLGLDPDAARAAIISGERRAQVDNDHKTAREVGVRSVPTFVVGRKGMAGAQPVEQIRALLTAPA